MRSSLLRCLVAQDICIFLKDAIINQFSNQELKSSGGYVVFYYCNIPDYGGKNGEMHQMQCNVWIHESCEKNEQNHDC